MVNLGDGITQTGTVKIALTNSSGDEAFNSKGQLVGTITGQEGFVTTLSHTAILKDGSSFITKGDMAYITGVRAYTPEGVPCSFYVQEYLTDITQGMSLSPLKTVVPGPDSVRQSSTYCAGKLLWTSMKICFLEKSFTRAFSILNFNEKSQSMALSLADNFECQSSPTE
jgi:hypothetical protein